MTWKCALLGLPYEGATGGVTCNPELMSTGELSRLTRAYASALTPFVGAQVDIPAPDVNSNEREMAWFLDEYECRVGCHEPSVVTGKPLAIGGIPGRSEATGRGVALITRLMLQEHGLDPRDARIVIQGFGNVGSQAASRLPAAGARVIAVSDASCTVFNSNGLDIPQLLAAVHSGPPRLLNEIGPGGDEVLDRATALTKDCEVLIPAALEGRIWAENAHMVPASIIVEAANGPTTAEADEILHTRGTMVVPDILANAGGVVVSYFEWWQGLQGNRWDLDDVRSRLD